MANLKKDTVIDHYQIISLLGAGGMGEVYKARDLNLKRDVALKLLPPEFLKDEQRVLRFELEARATGMLNHPNIMTVFDTGIYDGCQFITTELLEGETLRGYISKSPLSISRAIEFAIQVAKGLSAAHEKGIVHRDVKPENIFVTNDGFLKILDFGLAKQKTLEEDSNSKTEALLTEPGSIMGSVGYMSPEQVRGNPADNRSDIFSFGVVLCEMLTGIKIFDADTSAETMTAILKKDVTDIINSTNLPAGITKIVLRCLEKEPRDRFQSMKDLTFSLETLSGITAAKIIKKEKPKKTTWILIIPLLLTLSLAGLIMIQLFKKESQPISYHQITFSMGTVFTAKFAPDGKNIYYSASWEGKPKEIYATIPEGGGSRPFGISDADIVGISKAGEMAIILRKGLGFAPGTLAVAPLHGGPPKKILENIAWADWTKDGSSFAVVKNEGGKSILEYPLGKVLYKTSGFISHVHLSPDERKIAFLDHPFIYDDSGSVSVIDLKGKIRVLSKGWNSIEGLGWKPDGKEILFTAARVGGISSLYSVSLNGKQRLITSAPGRLVLHDISRDGKIVSERNTPRSSIVYYGRNLKKEKNLSWLDYSILADITSDGNNILFFEAGEGAREKYPIYIRNIDGSTPLKIGDGRALGFSPDGRYVLTIPKDETHFISLIPIGPGEIKTITAKGLENILWADYFPDGKRILIWGNEKNKGRCLYVQHLDSSIPKAITEDGISRPVRNMVSPDGKFVVAKKGNLFMLYPIDGGNPISIKGLDEDDLPFQWSINGKSLFIRDGIDNLAKIYILDIMTGERNFYCEILPSDPSGVLTISKIFISEKSGRIFYNFTRLLSDLYEINGIK